MLCYAESSFVAFVLCDAILLIEVCPLAKYVLHKNGFKAVLSML